MSVFHSSLKIEDIVEKIEYYSHGKFRVDNTSISYWSNMKIKLDNELVKSMPKLYSYVEYASFHDTLSRLHEYIDPIGGTINLSDCYSGYAKCRVVNLSMAKMLLIKGSYAANINTYEYEVIIVNNNGGYTYELVQVLKNAINKILN